MAKEPIKYIQIGTDDTEYYLVASSLEASNSDDSLITPGDGKGSIVLGNGTALGQRSVAEGEDVVAGCKGYYIDQIYLDDNNNTGYIYLRTDEVTDDNPARSPEWVS